MFVNFDWAGHDGAADHPVTVATEGVGPREIIAQEHDRQVLRMSLRDGSSHSGRAEPSDGDKAPVYSLKRIGDR